MSIDPAVAELAAFGQLCEEHGPRLLAMLERRIDPRLRQRLAPEDILQSAFVKAQDRWPAYRAGSPMRPYPWLYQLALDTLYEEYRRHGRAARDLRHDLPWPDESLDVLAGSLTSPSQAMARDELIGRVRQVIELLKPVDREVLWLRYFEEMPARDVGELLGLTEGRQHENVPGA